MPLPLPPPPKVEDPQVAAESGDPYAMLHRSLFVPHGYKGFVRWYRKETWKFFDGGESYMRTPVKKKPREPVAPQPPPRQRVSNITSDVIEAKKGKSNKKSTSRLISQLLSECNEETGVQRPPPPRRITKLGKARNWKGGGGMSPSVRQLRDLKRSLAAVKREAKARQLKAV